MTEPLRAERIGAAEVLTIDRPAAGNAMNAGLADAFEAALDRLEGDTDLRAVIVTGAGDKFFCAGGDLKQYRDLTTRAELDAVFIRTRRMLDRFEALPVPVIAAINGYALGGGGELMLATDIRLAASHAKIGFPQVRLGIITGWHGIERLVRSVGYPVAMRLAATGEPVTAAEAARIGLINEAVEDRPVLDAALEIVEGLAKAAPLALAATKRIVRAAYDLPPAEARRRSIETFADLWFSADHREAEAAFAEKRPPVFLGRRVVGCNRCR